MWSARRQMMVVVVTVENGKLEVVSMWSARLMAVVMMVEIDK